MLRTHAILKAEGQQIQFLLTKAIICIQIFEVLLRFDSSCD